MCNTQIGIWTISFLRFIAFIKSSVVPWKQVWLEASLACWSSSGSAADVILIRQSEVFKGGRSQQKGPGLPEGNTAVDRDQMAKDAHLSSPCCSIYSYRWIELLIHTDPTCFILRFITVWIPVAVDSGQGMRTCVCGLAPMLNVGTRTTFSWKASGEATIPDTLSSPTTKVSLIATRTTWTSDSWKE